VRAEIKFSLMFIFVAVTEEPLELDVRSLGQIINIPRNRI
jgi:hypothetical protein